MDPALETLGRMSAQASVPVWEFVLQLAGAMVASAVLAWLYVRFGRSPGNRRSLAALFVPLTLTTMFVIAVVKTSLALSLGLVGALSIVRFRTAIREPEELIYLFVCIGLGLGFGANQWIIVSLAFGAVAASLVTLAALRRRTEQVKAQWLLVQLPVGAGAAVSLADLSGAVGGIARRASLTRYDAGATKVEATFDVELASPVESLAKLIDAVQRLAPGARCLVIDQSQRPIE